MGALSRGSPSGTKTRAWASHAPRQRSKSRTTPLHSSLHGISQCESPPLLFAPIQCPVVVSGFNGSLMVAGSCPVLGSSALRTIKYQIIFPLIFPIPDLHLAG